MPGWTAEGVEACGGVDERDLFLNPAMTQSGKKKKMGANSQTRQRGPALHQTLVSSHDPLHNHTHTFYLRQNAVLTKKSPSAAALLNATYLHWRSHIGDGASQQRDVP